MIFNNTGTSIFVNNGVSPVDDNSLVLMLVNTIQMPIVSRHVDTHESSIQLMLVVHYANPIVSMNVLSIAVDL